MLMYNYICFKPGSPFKFRHILKELHFLLPSPTLCVFDVIVYIFIFISLLIVVVILDYTGFCFLSLY